MSRPADLEALLASLTLEQKASLTAGIDMWTIPGIPEAGIPRITVTDGPNGARGSSLLGAGRARAVCLPCGSALGSTFDPGLIEELGGLLAEEAHTKGARVLLAPTINLHRSPLYGRAFECYSEDPLLSGRIAAAFTRGLQAGGVAATPKHFVGNESELQRNTMSSDIDERTLRELYLVPFELAIKEGGALALMTAYNRLNGAWCTERPDLLTDIVRGEWGFEGIVMTDWFGVARTVPAALAGLDLEMPGPGRSFGPALAEAVAAGEVPESTLDAIVRRWLAFVDRLDAWDDPAEPDERSEDRPEHRALARRAATDSMVLLRNDGLLPLDASAVRAVALIGPNGGVVNMMGGGSAQLNPHYRVSPRQVLGARLGDRLTYELGCTIDKGLSVLGALHARRRDGSPGVDVEYFAGTAWEGEPAIEAADDELRLLTFGSPGAGLDPKEFSLRASCTVRAPATGRHTFSLLQAGRARLLVGGDVLLDGITDPPPPGSAFFGLGSEELRADVELTEGDDVEVVLEFTAAGSAILHGAQVGYRPPLDDDALLDRAVTAAAAADVAVVVVGTSAVWESEGHDRESMDLPGRQDELVRRVCAANPRTVVVVNTGSPVTMDWADEPAALLQVWLGGQELAGALDEVLFGEAEPAGRLSMTLPIRYEHSPAFPAGGGENHHVGYGEGVLIGYRWYGSRRLPVRFPFGHGGSYTTFAWGDATVGGASGEVVVEVPVTNTGSRRGAEVVQVYVEPPAGSRLHRPRRELRGFAKLWLEPGETAVARVELGARAFAYWDPGTAETAGLREALGRVADLVPAGAGAEPRPEAGWYIDAGEHAVVVARSAADEDIVARIPLAREAAGPLPR